MGQALSLFLAPFSSRRAGRECAHEGNMAVSVPPTLSTSESHRAEPDPAEFVFESNWAGLPSELIGLITQRLSIPDYCRFRAVCTSWASAVATEGYLPSGPHFPWLMLSHSPYSFLTLPDNRSYRCPPYEIRSTDCVGCRDGWLVTQSGFSEFGLLNPLTGSQISLPSFCTLSCVHIRKVVLSSTPSDATAGGFVAVAMYGLLYYRLAFAREGDVAWAPLNPSPRKDRDVEDVVYHDGKFFTISTLGQVQVFDLTGPHPVASAFSNSYMAAVPRSAGYDGYLVSSFGDLSSPHGRER